VHIQASGSSANGDSTAGPLFADYTFNLANSSATETFTLVFKALFGALGNTTNALALTPLPNRCSVCSTRRTMK
jgi:hypothetical protein